MDMGSVDSALYQEASPEEFSTSVASSGDARGSNVTDLALLMGVRPKEKGSATATKPRPIKDASNPRSSNSKKLRQANNLNQPRRMN